PLDRIASGRERHHEDIRWLESPWAISDGEEPADFFNGRVGPYIYARALKKYNDTLARTNAKAAVVSSLAVFSFPSPLTALRSDHVLERLYLDNQHETYVPSL